MQLRPHLAEDGGHDVGEHGHGHGDNREIDVCDGFGDRRARNSIAPRSTAGSESLRIGVETRDREAARSLGRQGDRRAHQACADHRQPQLRGLNRHPAATSRFVRSRISGEELVESLGGERAAVGPLEVREHPLLAVGIDEADPLALLVLLDRRHESQALVDEVDDGAVGVRDLLSKPRDAWVLRGGVVGHAALLP